MSVKLVFNLLKNEGLEFDMGIYVVLFYGYGKYSNVIGVQNVIDEMKEKVSFILVKIGFKIVISVIGYCKDVICYQDYQFGIFTQCKIFIDFLGNFVFMIVLRFYVNICLNICMYFFFFISLKWLVIFFVQVIYVLLFI